MKGIGAKIAKAIALQPTTVSVFRRQTNAFHEATGTVFVAELTGLYSRRSRLGGITVQLFEGCAVKSALEERLMVVCDAESDKVQEGDTLKLGGAWYRIVDLGRNFDAYCSFTLERMGADER